MISNHLSQRCQCILNILFVTLVFCASVKLSSAFQHPTNSLAFSPVSNFRSPSQLYAENPENVSSSRRGVLEKLLFASAIPTIPFVSFVDSASAVDPSVAVELALRNVKRAQKQFEGLEPMVSANDYEGVKNGLRDAPFSEIRKNCGVLLRDSVAGKPDGFVSPLLTDYKLFIKGVEGLNAKATQGVNGRKGVDLKDTYSDAVAGLRGFVKLADLTSPTEELIPEEKAPQKDQFIVEQKTPEKEPSGETGSEQQLISKQTATSDETTLEKGDSEKSSSEELASEEKSAEKSSTEELTLEQKTPEKSPFDKFIFE